MINYSWCDCNNIQKLKSFHSPDLEYLTIKCRTYYLKREFSSVMVTGVNIPPQADTTTALKELHWTLCRLETTYPEAEFIVVGDFSKASLRKRIAKFYQHTDCTRAGNRSTTATLPLPGCLQGPPPSLRQIRSQLHFAPSLI